MPLDTGAALALDRVVPRSPSYAVSLAAAAGLVAALVTGCSPSGEPASGPSQESSAAEGFTAPELEAGGGAGAGGAPQLSGRRALTLTAARRLVIDEPCTANVIERLCGSSARFALEPRGEPTPVTLVSATTRTEPSGLTWRVRLRFAAADAPLPGPPDRGGDVRVLRGPGDLEREIGAGAETAGRTIDLTGLTKADAWGLVERLIDPIGAP